MGEVFNIFKKQQFRRERKMEDITVFDVAKYLLFSVDESSGSVMTHLKLQKLCYYTQAWNLVFNNKPMFNSRFEAWMHGPACPELWREYREHSWMPIPLIKDLDTEKFSPEQRETLDFVWENYGIYDGKYLEDLTHSEPPWINARCGCDPGDNCTTEITLESMKEYYSMVWADGEGERV